MPKRGTIFADGKELRRMADRDRGAGWGRALRAHRSGYGIFGTDNGTDGSEERSE